MLIEKKIKEGDIVAFLLNSGQEVIARLVKEDDKCFEVSKPLTIVATPNGPALTEAMMSAKFESTVQLQKTSVAMYGPVHEKIKSGYIEGTTGITPAPSGLKV